MQFGTALADPAAAQVRAVDALLRRVFDHLPVTTYRSHGSAPIAIAGSPTGASLGVRSYEDFAAHARVVAGSWPRPPSGKVAVAVSTALAASLGLHLGDTMTLDGTAATPAVVAAIFVPIIGGDPYFFDTGSPIPIADAAISDRDLARLTGAISAQWTVAVDAGNLHPDQVAPLRTAVDGLEQAVNNDVGVSSTTVRVAGGLADTLLTIAAGNAAFDSVRMIPVLLIGFIGSALLVVLVNLLIGQRRAELTLLRARGAGIARTVGFAATEMTVVAVAAAALGIVPAVTGVPAATGHSAEISWWSSVFTVGTTVGAVVGLTLRQAVSSEFGARRRTALLAAGPLTLIGLAAAFSLQRFRNLGSAISIDRNQLASIDPVAVWATTLTLLALTLLGAVAVGVAARPVALIAARGRRLRSSLTTREFARRWPVFGTVTLLVGLAVGGTSVAAGFEKTWNDYRRVSEQLADPADVRVITAGSPDAGFGRGDPSGRYRDLSGVTGADDVLLTGTQVGQTAVRLTAVSATRMNSVLPDVAGSFDRGRVQAGLRNRPIGLPVPTGAHRLTIDLTVLASTANSPDGSTPAPTDMDFVLWIAGPQGTVIPIDLGSAALQYPVPRTGPTAPTTITHRRIAVAIPTDGTPGWRVVGLDSTTAGGDVDTHFQVALDSVIGGGTELARVGTAGWSVQPVNGTTVGSARSGASNGSIGWSAEVPAGAGSTLVRLMPAAAQGSRAPTDGSALPGVPPVPIVVNAEVAQMVGLAVGSPLDLQLTATDRHLHAVVAMVSPLLPGPARAPGVLADTGTVLLQLLRTSTVVPASNEVWLRTSSAQMTADAARAVAGNGQVYVAAQDPGTALIRPTVSGLWFAAGAALLLSLFCLAATAASFASGRRSEVVVLRSAGLSRTTLVAGRRDELVAALGSAFVIGVIAGRLTAQATVPSLARAAVVESSQVSPHLAYAAAGWTALGAGAFLALLIVAAYGRVIGRQYRSSGTRTVDR